MPIAKRSARAIIARSRAGHRERRRDVAVTRAPPTRIRRCIGYCRTCSRKAGSILMSIEQLPVQSCDRHFRTDSGPDFTSTRHEPESPEHLHRNLPAVPPPDSMRDCHRLTGSSSLDCSAPGSTIPSNRWTRTASRSRGPGSNSDPQRVPSFELYGRTSSAPIHSRADRSRPLDSAHFRQAVFP